VRQNTRFILVETHHSAKSHEVIGLLNLANTIAQNETSVYLWLMQNGVLMLKGIDSELFRRVRSHPNISVFVDDVSLYQCGIALRPEECSGIKLASMAEFVSQLMADDTKTIWH
jgi:hypothetical protein